MRSCRLIALAARKVNQYLVKPDGAVYVDMNGVRPKVVREGFNLPGSWGCSQLFREGHGWFGKRTNGFE
jgi:hypothetical protein